MSSECGTLKFSQNKSQYQQLRYSAAAAKSVDFFSLYHQRCAFRQESESRAFLFDLASGKGGKGGSHDTVEASSPRTEKHRTKAQKPKSVWTRNIDASSLALGLVSFEQEGLYEIDAALKRIEDGTYGVCELTGKAIPWERLEAIPWTRFSIEVENQIEGNVHPHIGLIGRVRMGETELSGTGPNRLADDEVDSPVDLARPPFDPA